MHQHRQHQPQTGRQFSN